MATALKTVVTYPLDGQTTDFAIPFDYLARKFLKLTLLGKDRKELVLNTDYRFATRKTISLTQAWGGDDGYDQLEIRRYTSATERLVDFTDGSILRAYDLNVAQLQTMHIAEEARDLTADTIGVNIAGDLDARGHRIVNVAEAIEDGDAVSLGALKSMSNTAWQARNEAEGFRNEAEKFKQGAKEEADRASSEAGKATAAVGKVEQVAEEVRGEISTVQAEVGKVEQLAEKVRDEVYNVQVEVDKANQVVSEVKDRVADAEKFAFQAKEGAVVAERAAEGANEEADRAKKEADRAKAEADKISGTNQISAALESVTQTAVTFNREVASRSHLRCVTTGGNVPFTGVANAGGAQLYMTVDSSGNAGFTTDAPSSSPKFRAYWDTQGSTYVSTASTNLDQGSRQIKGSLEVGQGSNSAIHTFSKGEGTPNELVSATKWKWHDGGVELGTIRGNGDDCSGSMRTTSGGKSVSYQQDAKDGNHKFLNSEGKVVATIKPDGTFESTDGGGGSGGGGVELGTMRGLSDECTGLIRTTSGGSKVSYQQNAGEGTHVFLGNADKTVLTIHEDGDIETPLLGRLSEKLSDIGGGDGGGSSGGGGGGSLLWKGQAVAAVSPSEQSTVNLPFDVRGRRGYHTYTTMGKTVYMFFEYPPMDCNFQINRLKGYCVGEILAEGTKLRLKQPDDVGPEHFTFYAEVYD